MMKIKFHVGLFLTALFVMTFLGCWKPNNPDGRVDVSGTIRLNGQPLTHQSHVFFDPVNGTKGDGGNAPIYDGKFLFTRQAAPKPGKYIVRVYSSEEIDIRTGKPFGEAIPEKFIAVKTYIPDDYHVNSKLEFEVVQRKKNVFNYDIVTDFEPVIKQAVKK